MFTTMEYELQDGVATIIFNRPDMLNALNIQMVEELTEALETIHYSTEARVLIAA